VTDTEIIATAILGGAGVIGAAVRLSVSRVVKAIDDSTAAWTKVGDQVSKFTERLTSIESKLELRRDIQEAVEAIADEISGVHDTAVPVSVDDEDTGDFSMATARTPTVRRTPPGGYQIPKRARSKG